MTLKVEDKEQTVTFYNTAWTFWTKLRETRSQNNWINYNDRNDSCKSMIKATHKQLCSNNIYPGFLLHCLFYRCLHKISSDWLCLGWNERQFKLTHLKNQHIQKYSFLKYLVIHFACLYNHSCHKFKARNAASRYHRRVCARFQDRVINDVRHIRTAFQGSME